MTEPDIPEWVRELNRLLEPDLTDECRLPPPDHERNTEC